MAIKYKHCCILNNDDFVESDYTKLSTGEEVVKISVLDSESGFVTEIFLDKKTAIRFSKSVRTEINKIQ